MAHRAASLDGKKTSDDGVLWGAQEAAQRLQREGNSCRMTLDAVFIRCVARHRKRKAVVGFWLSTTDVCTNRKPNLERAFTASRAASRQCEPSTPGWDAAAGPSRDEQRAAAGDEAIGRRRLQQVQLLQRGGFFLVIFHFFRPVGIEALIAASVDKEVVFRPISVLFSVLLSAGDDIFGDKAHRCVRLQGWASVMCRTEYIRTPRGTMSTL